MSTTSQTVHPDRFRAILPLVSVSPAGDHFVDNQEMVEGWYTRLLSEEESRQVAEHLGGCSYCQEAVAEFYVLGLHHDYRSGKEKCFSRSPSDIAKATWPRRIMLFVSTAALLLLVSGIYLSQTGGKARELARQLNERRGITSAVTLAQRSLVSDYGFTMDGFSMMKSGPGETLLPLTPEEEEIRRDYHEASARFPENEILRLNYGQFLLEVGRLDESILQFETVLQQVPRQSEAELGLALALFAKRDFETSLHHFQTLLRKKPDSIPYLLNAAACHVQMDDNEAARSCWSKARSLCTDPVLRSEIEEMLKSSEGTIQ